MAFRVKRSPSAFLKDLARRPFLLILCGFFVLTTVSYSAVAPEMPEPPRAMWVWDVKVFQDDDATKRLLNFCKERNINLLFYTAYKVKGNLEADYRNFNKRAHKRGILVQALAGDPRWALERYHLRILEWTLEILEFNSASAEIERFDGIHVDVEPYLLGKIWEEDNKNILAQTLQMYKKTRTLIAQSNSLITFAADLPFWYDDDTDMWIEWQKRVSPANYHILDMVDQIAIMDYRNFAEGDNGSVLLAKNEISYADSAGKKVYIGQETGKNLEPAYITFGGTNIDYMEKEIKKLVNAYINYKSFAGIAIHHYVSYKRLLKESGKTAE
jgi:hypothetical protein